MKITVIISAHKKRREMEFVLTGYAAQTRMPDEIIVSQDGEFPEIAEAVENCRHLGLPLIHLTQEHRGFGKCRALNKAILQASGDLLLFTDGDCIPRDDFVDTYLRLSRPGAFLAGGSHISVPEAYHLNNDLRPAILDQRLFDYGFLSAIPGFDKSRNRLLRNPRLRRFYDFLSPRNAFSGANSCAWRHDVLEVGGFDESMAYGGEDLNIGLRLNNIGVRGVRARHSIVSLHLDHGRGYYDAALHQANQDWNKEVRSRGHVFPRVSPIRQLKP
ncbi:glycosyltransferase [Pseudoduganella aquatica]|uniref:Glycosyltransferase n=1 Tax=Pseudoduganella aquatica TaxID=2660641 RepID=A0A7X4KLP9_9BURK|nr:glycosyltransferase [Pseudoduganella aquatica]MYN07362.1 glycosyltransferase [Pseudoduganella aquatica]